MVTEGKTEQGPKCPTCKTPLAGKPTGGIGRAVFCRDCYERHSKKRLCRMDRDLLGPPFLAKRAKEFRDAVQSYDQVRKQVAEEQERLQEEKARVRSAVERETIDRIRRLSFWHRLRLLFDPFGYAELPK